MRKIPEHMVVDVVDIVHVGVTEDGEFGERLRVLGIAVVIPVDGIADAAEADTVNTVFDGVVEGDTKEPGALGRAVKIGSVCDTLDEELVIILGGPVVEVLVELGVLEQGQCPTTVRRAACVKASP